MENFRHDTRKAREVTLYKKDIALAPVKESIEKFKKEIPWDFLD